MEARVSRTFPGLFDYKQAHYSEPNPAARAWFQVMIEHLKPCGLQMGSWVHHETTEAMGNSWPTSRAATERVLIRTTSATPCQDCSFAKQGTPGLPGSGDGPHGEKSRQMFGEHRLQVLLQSIHGIKNCLHVDEFTVAHDEPLEEELRAIKGDGFDASPAHHRRGRRISTHPPMPQAYMELTLPPLQFPDADWPAPSFLARITQLSPREQVPYRNRGFLQPISWRSMIPRKLFARHFSREGLTGFEGLSVASWLVFDRSLNKERLVNRGEILFIFGLTQEEMAPWLTFHSCEGATATGTCLHDGHICPGCAELYDLLGQAWDVHLMTDVALRHVALWNRGLLNGQESPPGALGPTHGCGGSCTYRRTTGNIK